MTPTQPTKPPHPPINSPLATPPVLPHHYLKAQVPTGTTRPAPPVSGPLRPPPTPRPSRMSGPLLQTNLGSGAYLVPAARTTQLQRRGRTCLLPSPAGQRRHASTVLAGTQVLRAPGPTLNFRSGEKRNEGGRSSSSPSLGESANR